MRGLSFFTILVLTNILLFSCGKQEGEEQQQQFQKEALITFPETENLRPTFSQEGGDFSISFNSTDEWTTSIINDRADSWCSVSPSSGKAGNNQIIVKVKINESTDERNATIQIKSKSTTKDIIVTQKQRDALSLTSSKVEIAAEGGSFNIEVNANIAFSYKVDESSSSWIKPSHTKTLEKTQLSFSVLPNEVFSKREGSIIISAMGLSEVFHVYQEGDKPSIVLSKNDFSIDHKGGKIDVEVKSNVSVSLFIPEDCDWIKEAKTKSMSTNTYSLTILENPLTENRTSIIKFENTENNLSESVTITQAQKDALVIEKTDYVIGYKGDIIAVDLLSNVDFDFSTEADWIVYTESKAMASSTLSFAIKENLQYEPRVGIIRFSFGNDREIVDVKITQEGATRVESISFNQTSYSLFVGQTVAPKVTISPEDAYYQSIGWTSDNPSVASVSSDGIIQALSAGKAVVSVSCGGISNTCEIVVSGTANCYLISSPGTYFIPLVKGKTKNKLSDVSRVSVLWESFGTDIQPNTGDIISSVSLDNGIIKYSTPKSLNDGNALIAAYDSKGTILWSWHIWVCSNYNPERNTSSYSDSKKHYFMDRNIGATSSTPGDVKALGLQYQWGRKDPFLGPSSTLGIDIPFAKSSGKKFNSVSSGQVSGTIEYAIENPMTIIGGVSASSGDWFYQYRATAFWGADIDLYDPCPDGWTVPRIEEWYPWVDVSTNSYGIVVGTYQGSYPFDSEHYGMLFGSNYANPPTWYPAAGYYTSNLLYYAVGYQGFYWSASSGGQWGGTYAFYFNTNGALNAQYEDRRANLHPVRCIKQE